MAVLCVLIAKVGVRNELLPRLIITFPNSFLQNAKRSTTGCQQPPHAESLQVHWSVFIPQCVRALYAIVSIVCCKQVTEVGGDASLALSADLPQSDVLKRSLACSCPLLLCAAGPVKSAGAAPPALDPTHLATGRRPTGLTLPGMTDPTHLQPMRARHTPHPPVTLAGPLTALGPSPFTLPHGGTWTLAEPRCALRSPGMLTSTSAAMTPPHHLHPLLAMLTMSLSTGPPCTGRPLPGKQAMSHTQKQITGSPCTQQAGNPTERLPTGDH